MNRTGSCCASAFIIIVGIVIIVIIAIATFVFFSMVVANFVVDICKLLASFYIVIPVIRPRKSTLSVIHKRYLK